MAQTSQDKTEKATGKRLNEARQKGQIGKSHDLTTVSVLFTGGMAIYMSRGIMLENFRRILETAWSKESFSGSGQIGSSGFFTSIVVSLFTMIAPIILTVVATAVVLNMIQMKGFIISFESLGLNFGKLNPLNGLKRMFSPRSLFELIKSIFKMTIVVYAAYSTVWPQRFALANLSEGEATDFLNFTGTLALRLLYRVAGIMFCLSCLDLFYQKWQTNKDLKMTKQETKDEQQQAEGNPQTKSRIRNIQRSLARQRMLTKVPKASVIITNPTHFAVALQYEPGMEAPMVVAKGVDSLALKIIDTGRKHGVSIVRNPPLARALYKQVKLDERIPVELYRAVAKILAYIYQQKQGTRRN